jgi:hypothetical protein
VSVSMIRPCSMMATRSQNRSASSIRWVETGGQLVEKHYFWIVDQRKSDKQSLFLTTGKVHELGAPLVG